MYTVETYVGNAGEKGYWQVYAENLSRKDAMVLFERLLSEDEFGVRLTCEPVYHG